MSDIQAPVAAPVEAAAPAPEASQEAQQELSAEDIAAEEAALASEEPEAAKKEDKKSNKRKYSLKVDGKMEDLELDLDNEEEVKKHLQMSKAAQKRMQEAAKVREAAAQLIEDLRNDPGKVLSDPRLNISPELRRKLAESIMNNELEEMQKTPEQREKEALQKELEDYKKKYEEDKKRSEEQEFERIKTQAIQQFDTDISSAIEKTGLPKTAYTVKQMAEAMMLCVENGLDLSAQDLAPYIKKNTLSDLQELVNSLGDDDFENFLGKQNIQRIRKRSLARLKTSAPQTAKDIKPTVKESSESKPAEKISAKKFFSNF